MKRKEEEQELVFGQNLMTTELLKIKVLMLPFGSEKTCRNQK